MKTLRDLVVVRGVGTPIGLDRADPPDEDAPKSNGAFDPADPPVMAIRFSIFDTWYEIDSFWEGKFLERTARGSFKKTIKERGDRTKVLFNHGMDFHIGDKILGVPSLLEEREDSPYSEVPMLDTSYNRDLYPGLAAGGYGSSFMFQVLRDKWEYEPKASDYNPDAIPERTILEVRLLEFGPVTWPANPEATAGIRSMTDWYADKLRGRSPEQYDTLNERYTDFRAEHGFRTSDTDAARSGTSAEEAATPTDAPNTPVVVHPSGLSPHARARLLAYPFLTQGADQNV